jgi:hypothetical protein
LRLRSRCMMLRRRCTGTGFCGHFAFLGENACYVNQDFSECLIN